MVLGARLASPFPTPLLLDLPSRIHHGGWVHPVIRNACGWPVSRASSQLGNRSGPTSRTCLPGPVRLRRGEMRQLGDPRLDKHRVRVVLLALAHSLELAVAGVVASAGVVGPVEGVDGKVVVYQQALKQQRAPPPVNLQPLGEEAGHILAPPIAHEPGAPQLPHAGVNEGQPGLSAGPPLKACHVSAPGGATTSQLQQAAWEPASRPHWYDRDRGNSSAHTTLVAAYHSRKCT